MSWVSGSSFALKASECSVIWFLPVSRAETKVAWDAANSFCFSFDGSFGSSATGFRLSLPSIVVSKPNSVGFSSLPSENAKKQWPGTMTK